METKVCRTCGEAVPLNGFYKGGTGKPKPDCKECTKKAQRAKNDRLKQRSLEEAITKTEKRCNGCGQTLPVAQFGIALVNPDGLKPICKPCEATRSKTWVGQKPERMQAARDRAKNWREDNPERFREQVAKWERENPEKHRATLLRAYKKYRASEHGQQKRREFQKKLNETGLGAAYKRKRDAVKLQATPAWYDLEQVKPIYEQAAVLSEATGQPWEVDHIDPLQGELVCGLHVAANLTPTTRSENRAKINKFTPYRIDADGNRYELSGEEWLIIK